MVHGMDFIEDILYIGIMSKAGRTHIAIEILICKMGLILNYEDLEEFCPYIIFFFKY